MKKPGEISYVKKTYKMLVVSMSYISTFHYDFHSQHSAHQQQFEVESKSILNKVYEFSAVDSLLDGKQHTVDKMINLQIFIDEMNIASVSFDLSKEKVVKEDSKSLFRRRFNDRKGYVDYKLIGVSTTIISKEQFRNEQSNRNRLYMRKKLDYKTLKKDNDRLEFQILQKDKMVESLSNKINDLLHQNIDLNRKVSEDMQKIRNPLNIKVNILATAKREDNNAVSAIDKINVCQMERDLEFTQEQCMQLKERIAELEIQNRKLQEKCLIFMKEFTHQFRGEKIKEVQKKFAQIDALQMLKKSISHYQRQTNFLQSQKTYVIQQVQQEKPKNIFQILSRQASKTQRSTSPNQNQIGQREKRQYYQSFNPLANKTQSKRYPTVVQKGQRSAREDVSQEKLNSSSLYRITFLDQQTKEKGEQPSPSFNNNKASAIIKSLAEAVAKDTNISKQQQRLLLARLQTKQKEIQSLENQLLKKQSIIDKMLVKEKMLEQFNNELAQEKARMLTTSALNLVGVNASSEVLAKIKQLSVYNNQILKQKNQLSEQLRQLKQQLNQRGKRLTQFQGVSRKSLMMLSQIGREKEVMQSKMREILEDQKLKGSNLVEEKNAKYQRLKSQYISCQSELRQTKQKLIQSELELESARQKLNIAEDQNKGLKQTKTRLETSVSLHEGQKKQHDLLSKKYAQIERLQKGLKSFVIRLQGEYYKKIKNPSEEELRLNIKKLLKQTYDKINQFQKDYYEVLLISFQHIKQATEKYYEDTHKFYEGIASQVENKEEIQEKKAEIIKERNRKMDLIKEKEDKIKEKMDKKIVMAEEQHALAIEGIKRLQTKLKEFQSYKIHLKELNKNQKFAVPIFNTPENSMHQSLIQMMEMFKSGQSIPPKQTISAMKSSGNLKSSAKAELKSKQTNKNIMKIEQEEEQDAEKAPFINISMLKNTEDPALKKQISSKPLNNSSSWEKISQNLPENSKASMLDIHKSNLSKMISEKQKYKESLLLSIAKKTQFSKQRMLMRERQMQTLKQMGTKIRKLEKQILNEQAEKQRAIFKHKERQNEFEKQFRAAQQNAELSIKKTSKQRELISIEIQVLKAEVQEKNTLIERLSKEIQATNQELLQTIAERNDLRMRNEEMNKIIADYQKVQEIMKQQVREIQANYLKNEEQMSRIIQERSMQFMHIEKIKSVEIQKLKSMIVQLQGNLSEEVNDNLQQKNTIEQLKQELKKVEGQIEEIRQQSKLTINRLSTELNEERQMNAAFEKEVEIYQKNIFELSQDLEAQEKEILRLNRQIQKLQSEKTMYKRLDQDLKERQYNLKQDYSKYDYILSQKNLKIKQWEQNYLKLEQTINLIKAQAQNIKLQDNKLKQEMDHVKQRQFNMERLVIQLEKQKSIEQIKNQKLTMQIYELESDRQKMQVSIQELTQKILKLQSSSKNLLQPPRTPRSPQSPHSMHSQTNQGHYKTSAHQFGIASVRSIRQMDSYHSVRTTKQKTQQSLDTQQKAKGKQEEKFKMDNSDFLTNKSQSSMKISKVLDPNFESMTIESDNKMNRKRPTQLIQVKEMKRNRYLNLPSIDVQAQSSGQNSNLGIIQEHNDQMEDTFLRSQSPQKAKHRKLAEQLEDNEIHYQIQFHQPKHMEQSAVDIDVMESIHSQHHQKHYNQNNQQGDEFEQLNDDNEEIYNEFRDYQPNEFVHEIIRLRLLIEQLTKRLEQQSYEYNLLDSPILQVPEIRITQKSDKSAFEKSSRDYIAESNHSKKVQRLQSHRSAKSVNFGDLQIKTLEEELQTIRKKASDEQSKNAEKELVITEQEQEIGALTQKNNQKQANIEKLIEQLKRVSENNEQIITQNKRLKVIGRQLKARLQESFQQFTAKCQQLISQSMKKDQSLLQLNLQLQKESKVRGILQEKLNQAEKMKNNLQEKMVGLQKQIHKNKKEYLKYEQQAEIEILKLKEQNDQLKALLNQKSNELMVMAQKYVELEQQKMNLLVIVKQTDATRREYEKSIQKVKIECNYVKNQYDNLQEKRKKVIKQTKNLEHDNIRLRQELQTVHNNTAIEIQKFNIKSNQQKEVISSLKQKLKQKEQVIAQLKNEIALYNNQTQQLKTSNLQLSEELAKAERSLKEIMVCYEQEFKKISAKQRVREEKIQQTKNLSQQKGFELSFKDKELKNLYIELKALREQNADLMSKIQKSRVSNAAKVRQLQNQMALKNDKIIRLANEVSILQTKLSEEKIQVVGKAALNKINTLQAHNDELQAKLEDLYKQLANAQKQLTQRPQAKEYNELKYKIQVLQSSLRHYSQSAKNQIQKISEQDRQINSTYKKQLQKTSKLLIREKQKNNHAINQLRQVVEAYKQLESKNTSMNGQLESENRANSILRLENRHLQKLVDQLQKENDQLQKSHASLLSKRSFSRQLTDATLI